jgi:putative component of toxin-antitoxin plasmid stabilization module
LPGLQDYVWTKEYNEYLQNVQDETLKETVNKRLQSLFLVIFNLPENQLM